LYAIEKKRKQTLKNQKAEIMEERRKEGIGEEKKGSPSPDRQ
jgi:hypothetical protein